MTLAESLRSLSGYPIPAAVIGRIAAARGVESGWEACASAMSEPSYRLAVADVYAWLSVAPDVSQGGISYSLSAEDKARFRSMSGAIYGELGDEVSGGTLDGTRFGYKGPRL